MTKDKLGNRMKAYYEDISKTKLTRRMPVIIRLDGCHFHTFTRGFKRPFDEDLVWVMQQTMKYLCENIQGVVLGYTQSDEITLILVDYKKFNSSAWFDYEVQKITSVSAAMATFAFNKYLTYIRDKTIAESYVDEIEGNQRVRMLKSAVVAGAIFDSRAFNIPKEEVANCLLWRQLDAEKNSVSSLARTYYSQAKLNGVNRTDQLGKIKEAGGEWEKLPNHLKYGSCCRKIKVEENGFTKSVWEIDQNIPKFIGEDRKYIEDLVDFESVD